MALYAQAGVAPLCLQGQREHGLRVNWLLWLLWLEHRHQVADPELLDTAAAHTDSWYACAIVPWRRLRCRAAPGPQREGLLRAELLCEREELRRLARLQTRRGANDNLATYIQWLDQPALDTWCGRLRDALQGTLHPRPV